MTEPSNMPPDDRTASQLRACAAIVQCSGFDASPALSTFLWDLADSLDEQTEETTDEH